MLFAIVRNVEVNMNEIMNFIFSVLTFHAKFDFINFV